MADIPNPPSSPSGDPLGQYKIGNAFGAASSKGVTRIGLFMATNLAVVAVFTIVAQVLGVDPSGVAGIGFLALAFGMGGSFISLLMSKSMAKRSTGAQVIENPSNEMEQWLVSTVQKLSTQAGIGMPEVAIFGSEAPNAFATGAKRDDALVAVSVGLLRSMDRSQAEAVLAHEIAHIANGDMITLTLIQGVANSIVIFVSRLIAGIFRDNRLLYFAAIIVLQMGFGLLANMVVMWFSRRREFRADAGAAALVGPAPMASALAALASGGPAPSLPDEMAALGIRKSGERKFFATLLSSHPPIPDRIAALQNPGI